MTTARYQRDIGKREQRHFLSHSSSIYGVSGMFWIDCATLSAGTGEMYTCGLTLAAVSCSSYNRRSTEQQERCHSKSVQCIQWKSDAFPSSCCTDSRQECGK